MFATLWDKMLEAHLLFVMCHNNLATILNQNALRKSQIEEIVDVYRKEPTPENLRAIYLKQSVVHSDNMVSEAKKRYTESRNALAEFLPDFETGLVSGLHTSGERSGFSKIVPLILD